MIKTPFDIVGYAQPLVSHVGEKVAFKLSADRTVNADVGVVRLLCADPKPTGPGVEYEIVEPIEKNARIDRYQKAPAGSYVELPLRTEDGPITIGMLIWPTLLGKKVQTLFSRRDVEKGCSIALDLDTKGCLSLQLRNGDQTQTLTSEVAVECRRWYFVSAMIDQQERVVTLRIDGIDIQFLEPFIETQTATFNIDMVSVDHASLSLACKIETQNGRPIPTECFNGKIEHPVVATGDVSFDALKELVTGSALELPQGTVLANWDFSAGIAGVGVTDISGNEFHGAVINLPARAVTGFHFSGEVLDWRSAPKQYAAIHFHDDDLYDCAWDTDFEWQVPKDVKTGFYALRIATEETEYWISFFVCAKPSEARNRIAFVASNATFLAYANTRHRMDVGHIEQLYNTLIEVSPTEAYLRCRRDLAPSTYDTHADGSGAFYSSPRRPILNMRPGKYTFNYINDSHLIAWLEKKGIEYDVIADDDIHQHGAELLSKYDVVITGSHPEYISTAMLEAFETYQNAGGRHLYLGGNGFYWRIGYPHDTPDAIEIRRGFAGVRTWESDPGEVHLSSTGEPSGLWREHGKAPQKLVGVGFSSCVFDRSTYYRRTADGDNPKAAFIFEGIDQDERIGDFGFRGNGAAGMELDRAAEALGTPRHALVVATTEDVGAGGSVASEEFISTPRATDGEQNGRVRGDMVFMETREGGAVFTPGSIAWPTSLLHNNTDNNVSRITENVIMRFLDPKGFS